MTDLAAQIFAALDRAEETAQAATPGPWVAYGNGEVASPGHINPSVGLCKTWNTAHIAANDPAHVLRLTTALREVVELHTPGSERDPMTGVWVETDWCATCDADTFPCPTLRALASVWDVPGDNT